MSVVMKLPVLLAAIRAIMFLFIIISSFIPMLLFGLRRGLCWYMTSPMSDHLIT